MRPQIDEPELLTPQNRPDVAPTTNLNRNGVAAFIYSLLLLVVMVIGFQFGRNFLRAAIEGLSPTGEVRIYANIERGTAIEIFVNEDFTVSRSTLIKPGVPTRYDFKRVPVPISYLRIDPTDQPGAIVKIEKVEIFRDGSLVDTLPLAVLSGWQLQQLEATSDATAFKAVGNDPTIIAGGLNLAARNPNAAGTESLLELATDWINRNSVLLLFGLIGAIFLLGSAAISQTLPLLVVALTLSVVGYPIVMAVTNFFAAPVDISKAVGHAAYVGFPKDSERLAFFVTCAVALALGAGFGRIVRKFSKPIQESVGNSNLSQRSLFVPVVVIACFAFLQFPQLSRSWDQIANLKHSLAGFDWSNIFTWDYLAYNGLLPYRDYWFPYGGEQFQLGVFPAGRMGTYVVQVILCAAISFSLYELFDRRPLPFLVTLFVLAAYIEVNLFVGTKRYLTATTAILAAAALSKRQSHAKLPYLAFGAFVGWIFWREPSQLGYAAPGLLFLLGREFLFARRDSTLRVFWARTVLVAAAAALVASVEVVRMAVNGQLESFVTTYSHLTSISVSSAIPTYLQRWFSFTSHYENILCIGLHLLLAYGAFSLARAQKNSRDWLGPLILALGLLTAVIYLKMLIRPSMALHVLVPIYFGAALLAGDILKRSSALQKSCAYFFIGAIIGSTTAGTWTVEKGWALSERAEQVRTDVGIAFSKGLEVSPEQRDSYYAVDRYKDIEPDTQALIDFLKSKNFPPLSQNFFVFGDDSYLYPMLHARPCPYISSFDASNVWAQNDVIACLQNTNPRYIVWNTSNFSFDAVPTIVRVPLTLNYIVEHYVPEQSFGHFEILKPRAGEPFNWAFWSEKLGTSVNLGAVPNLSMGCPAKSAKPSTGREREFLRLPDARVNGEPVNLVVSIADKSFNVSYNPVLFPQKKSDDIALSRLWFWDVAQQENLPRRVELKGNPKALRVQTCLIDDANRLY